MAATAKHGESYGGDGGDERLTAERRPQLVEQHQAENQLEKFTQATDA